MTRLLSIFAILAFVLSACGAPENNVAGPRVYRIKSGEKGDIQYRTLDSINSLRSAAGLTPLTFSSQLNAAAATHSRDMSLQNRPWWFGSDGSSPIDRVARTGYPGRNLGENSFETYESEIATLAAWMDQSDTRSVIMDPAARDLGFAWYQEKAGKIWWTLVTGG